MRVVFLDFDGVLNSRAFQERLRASGADLGPVVGLDPEAVRRLNGLVDAHVVVSSTWRLIRTVAELRGLLRDAGFEGPVLGATPRSVRILPGGLWEGQRRGFEIQAWLDAAPDYGLSVGSFAVVDDDSDMAHLAGRLVKTDFATGLLDEHVDRLNAMLDRPDPAVLLR